MMNKAALRDRIIGKTMDFGAEAAGVCLAADLLAGDAHRKFPLPEGIEKHHSILVIAFSHPSEKPELDYYVRRESAQFGNSMGNRELMDISNRVGGWLKQEGITSNDLHYYVEMGGVFLKGAAVLAGLGAVGINNLFIHPGYGARIRLRAHLIKEPLAPSVPLDFDPCMGCRKPCLNVCPASALDERGYHHDRCQEYMDREAAETTLLPAEGSGLMKREIRCCRICEFACSFVGTMEKFDQ